MVRRPSDTEPADQTPETPALNKTPAEPVSTPIVLEPVKRMCCGKHQPCIHPQE